MRGLGGGGVGGFLPRGESGRLSLQTQVKGGAWGDSGAQTDYVGELVGFGDGA